MASSSARKNAADEKIQMEKAMKEEAEVAVEKERETDEVYRASTSLDVQIPSLAASLDEQRSSFAARRPEGGCSAKARGKAAMATHKDNHAGMRGSSSWMPAIVEVDGEAQESTTEPGH